MQYGNIYAEYACFVVLVKAIANLEAMLCITTNVRYYWSLVWLLAAYLINSNTHKNIVPVAIFVTVKLHSIAAGCSYVRPLT